MAYCHVMAYRQIILLTPIEVAALARVSVKTVYRALWAGELDAVKVRGQWRVREAAVWQWIGVAAA
jgi:excisionase family DNA binding protein